MLIFQLEMLNKNYQKKLLKIKELFIYWRNMKKDKIHKYKKKRNQREIYHQGNKDNLISKRIQWNRSRKMLKRRKRMLSIRQEVYWIKLKHLLGISKGLLLN